VANKIKTDLTDITNNLTATQTFYNASSIQQANATLKLKDAIAQTKTSIDSLSTITTKLGTLNLLKYCEYETRSSVYSILCNTVANTDKFSW